MINVVLVDDERPALMELQYLLKGKKEFKIVGMFINAKDAMPQIALLKPDVVFLDINMPLMSGIEAAPQILSVSPHTSLVFVTAYDNYAIDAFEIHALDYVLKPISIERFEKTLDRISKVKRKKDPGIIDKAEDNSVKRLKLRCFGGLQLYWEGCEPIKWRTEKNRELFAYLLQNNGNCITKDELLDRLWPEDPPDRAIRQLYNGIYYIRKALELYGIEKKHLSLGNNYNLVLGEVDFDVDIFKQKAAVLMSLRTQELQEMEALYNEEYLYGDAFEWLEIERESLSNKYYQCLMLLTDKYMKDEMWNAAESVLLKAYNKYPFEECISEKLMRIYLATGNKIKAVQHMAVFSKFLMDELGESPNDNILQLYGRF